MHARSDFEPARRARPSRGRQGSSSGIRALAPSHGPPASFCSSAAQANARGADPQCSSAYRGQACVLSCAHQGRAPPRLGSCGPKNRCVQRAPSGPRRMTSVLMNYAFSPPRHPSRRRRARALSPRALLLPYASAEAPRAFRKRHRFGPSPGDLRARPGGIHSAKSLCWRWMIRAMLYRGERGRAGRGCGMRSD
jgi:hypothetical protein